MILKYFSSRCYDRPLFITPQIIISCEFSCFFTQCQLLNQTFVIEVRNSHSRIKSQSFSVYSILGCNVNRHMSYTSLKFVLFECIIVVKHPSSGSKIAQLQYKTNLFLFKCSEPQLILGRETICLLIRNLKGADLHIQNCVVQFVISACRFT